MKLPCLLRTVSNKNLNIQTVMVLTLLTQHCLYKPHTYQTEEQPTYCRSLMQPNILSARPMYKQKLPDHHSDYLCATFPAKL